MTRTVEDISTEMQSLVDKADGRALTDDEVAAYETLEVELKATKRTEEIRARQAAYGTVAPLGPVAPARRDDGLEQAFNHYLRTGKENADLSELRAAQSEGTASEGGFMVPDGFRQKIVDRMVAFGGVANVAQTIVTDRGDNLPWVTLDDTANTGEIVSEGGTFSSGADLVFGTASLGAYSYAAGGASATPLRVSLELLQDSSFNVEELVSSKLGERIARLQATHLVSGTGVGQPRGIVYGITGNEVSSALSYNDLVGFIHDVDPAYRANARWVFNDASLEAIRKLTDSHGDPIWRPDNANMATDLGGGVLLGYPVTIDQAFGDIVLTNGADDNWGVFGDIREGYVVRRVRDIAVLVNPYSRMANRQVEYSVWARMDARPQNTNAYQVLSGYTA